MFENADVAGVISAGTQSHVNVKPGEVITKENCKEISNIKVVPSEAVSNGVIVSLDSDSTWTVTGTSYLTSLTIAEGAKITGKNLKMYVNGVETEIAPGTYTGNIKLAVE
ncbi:hypothetical protein D2962_01100 [Biomaibacter acetigenes]|uniref:Uncharacterized protein n=1 Tax=Biomaibacter acetigenes TaxID=2316383 RepID=A0A3G2R1P6_9FIRM|nr:hypothetical protein D2962_01100 [Biomaibacter acetigenes]